MTAGVAPMGKTERDENFPVASRLIAAPYRAPILTFYRFARKADDIADHPSLAPQAKLDGLDALEQSLTGARESEPEGVALRAALAARGLAAKHARDLIAAFRLDVVKHRYRDWADLMDYCSISAMPVGRFVLDVHGQSAALWPASDAICASLQVINHLQDCGEDYARLDRVYLPEETLARHGAAVADLAARKSTPALRAAIAELADKSDALLDQGAALAGQVGDWRLACEIGAITRLARANVRRVIRFDPLSERVHPGKGAFVWTGLIGALEGALARAGAHRAAPVVARRP
jgi:hydroxysqualene synthase